MNPLKALLGLVSLVFDWFAPVKKQPWPDSEEPLIVNGEESGTKWTWPSPQQAIPCSHTFGDDHPCARCGRAGGNMTAEPIAAFEPMPGWFRGGFDEETSAPSGSATATRVDPAAEGPAAGRAHTLAAGHPNVTAALRVSAAIGLREYAESNDCETPTFWKSIADQLDPK